MKLVPKSRLKTDKMLLFSIFVLLVVGFLVFASASLGILSQNESKFYSILKSQALYVFILGPAALYIATKIEYFYYKKFAILIFIFTYLFSFSTLLPGIGFSHNGATRWIHLFGFSLQPSEILKLGVVVFFSYLVLRFKAYFKKSDLEHYKFNLLPFLAIWILLAVPILFLQRDFGTLAVMGFSSFVIYLLSGVSWRNISLILGGGLIAFFILIELRPYMKERILTFIDPSRDVLGASYQLNQSLIAVGAGEVSGRGIGQSIQKFNYLPEQISDSIFAVYAEEVGLVGSIALIFIYLFIIWRSIYIIKRIGDSFAQMLGVGIICIFFFQTFLNIASTIGLMPLTGVPLPLVSRGGTSLVFLMFELGILLNISKYKII